MGRRIRGRSIEDLHGGPSAQNPSLGIGADGSSRRPLGLVIVGGLIFSQMITLYVTPVIYLWLEWFQEHVLDRVPFLRSAH